MADLALHIMVRRARYTVYQDAALEIWSAQGWATGEAPDYEFTLVNPVSITKLDQNGLETQRGHSTLPRMEGIMEPSDVTRRQLFAAVAAGIAGCVVPGISVGYPALPTTSRTVVTMWRGIQIEYVFDEQGRLLKEAWYGTPHVMRRNYEE